MMGPFKAIDSVLGHYFSIQGRAPRSEYWWFALFQTFGLCGAIAFDIAMIDPHAAVSTNPLSYATVIFALLTICPNFTSSIRRLHDTGRSGMWYLILFVPFGGIVFLIFMLLPSQHDDNIYGPPYGKSFRPTIGDDILDPLAPRKPRAKSNPYAVYAQMERQATMKSPEMQDARREVVSEYYRRNVLKQN